MEIQTVKISEEERIIISSFMGEEYPSDIDFNWLMPVVKKCSESFEHHQYDSEEYYHITEEIFHPDYSLSEFMDADIEAVYSRVVTYIKWHNQNKVSKASKPCPNCNETEQPCACMRNICHKCGKPVGNITFTVCDDCWDVYFPRK
jgi:hypothetical protein